MRPQALRPKTARAAARQGRMRTRLTPGEKPCRKRMATLACVYDTEPSPRRPHDIIAPPGGRHGHRTLRPRPRATAKWLAGSVRHDPAEVIAAAFSQAEARDPRHQRTWVVLADGAGHQLDLIRAEAQRRGVTIHIVIDLIHVLEYIWKAAWSLHSPGDPAAGDWVAVKALAVLAGDSTRAAAEITTETETAGLTAAQRTGADACVRYLTGKNEFLCYDQALAAGWPIATGVIEGACRHLIGDCDPDVLLVDHGPVRPAVWQLHPERPAARNHGTLGHVGDGMTPSCIPHGLSGVSGDTSPHDKDC